MSIFLIFLNYLSYLSNLLEMTHYFINKTFFTWTQPWHQTYPTLRLQFFYSCSSQSQRNNEFFSFTEENYVFVSKLHPTTFFTAVHLWISHLPTHFLLHTLALPDFEKHTFCLKCLLPGIKHLSSSTICSQKKTLRDLLFAVRSARLLRIPRHDFKLPCNFA